MKSICHTNNFRVILVVSIRASASRNVRVCAAADISHGDIAYHVPEFLLLNFKYITVRLTGTQHAHSSETRDFASSPIQSPTIEERKVRPALTVYTKRGTIDSPLAPRETLLALYDGDADKVDAVLKARDEGDISRNGHMFDIKAETPIERRTYRRDVVMALTGNPLHPFAVLHWS